MLGPSRICARRNIDWVPLESVHSLIRWWVGAVDLDFPLFVYRTCLFGATILAVGLSVPKKIKDILSRPKSNP